MLAGEISPTADDERLLTPSEISDGWRLACRAQAVADLTLELAQWEAPILADDTPFTFTPQEGLGIAVDLGTTTLVAQLLDLRSGNVLAVRTGLNEQAQYGADLMSRIDFAIADAGQVKLQGMVREQIYGLIGELLHRAGHDPAELKNLVLVGNTVMHHLFSGVDVNPLAHHPFEPEDDGLKRFQPADLDWKLSALPAGAKRPAAPITSSRASGAAVRFLPCLGGFVGSDILAGILATELHESRELVGLVDLGTNGEIVIGNRERMLCASTAAGPAFEGARIAMGMRAATGAIAAVNVEDGQLQCQVLGHVPPRGICGSGLVDAVAAGLELGRILPSGRLAAGKTLPLCASVEITQVDIRELQLAKGAIAAGIRLLAEQWGTAVENITRIYLAGAFGNYINRQSARRIGLLPFGPEKVVAAGNTALLGAKLALFGLHESDGSFSELRARIKHVSLKEDLRFQTVFVEEMGFPD